jgi:hypothetical protein
VYGTSLPSSWRCLQQQGLCTAIAVIGPGLVFISFIFISFAAAVNIADKNETSIAIQMVKSQAFAYSLTHIMTYKLEIGHSW